MSYTPNPQNQGWVTCRDRLLDCIAKWQKKFRAIDVSIDCPAAPRYNSVFGNRAERAVSVTFTAGSHINRTVRVDRFERPVDNLWALAIGLDAVRLNEMRGLDDVARQVYGLLSAPKQRDPWEVLGIRPGQPREMIDAAFRAKSKMAHPDMPGGSHEAMQELNEAREAALATLGVPK
ncbi:MAG: J domain-containing protein [Gemmatimonadaceae bacterium]|nr:J domain-containing protein [Gemmatimonadaceae bacterium]